MTSKSLGITTVLILALTLTGTAAAKEKAGKEKWVDYVPVATEEQLLSGPAAVNDGAVGLKVKKAPVGLLVKEVLPKSPAEKAGLRSGDILVVVNEKPLSGVSEADFYTLVHRSPGAIWQVQYLRDSQELAAPLTVEARGNVFPEERKLPSAVSQFVFAGRVRVLMAIRAGEDEAIRGFVMLENLGESTLAVDAAKFFILDAQGRQLRQHSYAELRHSILSAIAENDQAFAPPPPPPPPRRYLISGTTHGSYTVTPAGNVAIVSGSSTGTYTAQPQSDTGQQVAEGAAAIARAIQQIRAHRENKKLFALLEDWDRNHFDTASPVIPGESRQGVILYYPLGSATAMSRLKVVLFLSDPETGQDTPVTFEFRRP